MLLLPNALNEPGFVRELIEIDPDDNKFIDCYIAGSANALLGNDKHFDILGQINFPMVTVLKYEAYESLYKDEFSAWMSGLPHVCIAIISTGIHNPESH